MKTLTTLALTLALTGGALSVQAAEQTDQELDQCMAELHAYYGEDTELNLVDRRRSQYGTRMRVAARLDADNSYFANCWVATDDISGLEEGASDEMLVATTSVASTH
jgi:hypothetical protein